MCQVVVSKLGTILFYSGIHFKPLKCVTNREDLNRHIPQKIKEFSSVAFAGTYPLVYLVIDNIQDVILSRP